MASMDLVTVLKKIFSEQIKHNILDSDSSETIKHQKYDLNNHCAENLHLKNQILLFFT